MAFYQGLLPSVSLLANTREDELHCCHDGRDHTAVAWYLERMKADSKMAVGSIRARIDAQDVEGGLRMSYARMVGVGENTALTKVVDMNFVAADMALD